MSDSFDANTYWRQRVGDDATVGVVGHRSFGVAYNEYIYQRRIDVLNDFLAEYPSSIQNTSLLDIGCGSGFYTRYWQQKGIRDYLGIDLSADTIKRLTTEYPRFCFQQHDITASVAVPGRQFSLITVFDVLYHIVDDKKALDALQHISKQLEPGGVIVVFEQRTKKDYALRPHVRFRSRQQYNAMLTTVGLEIVSARQLFSVLVPPLAGRRWIDIPVAAIYKLLGVAMKHIPLLGHVIGKTLYEVDKLLLRFGVKIPNNEMLVLHHRTQNED